MVSANPLRNFNPAGCRAFLQNLEISGNFPLRPLVYSNRIRDSLRQSGGLAIKDRF
jgi:hypothetical protein